MLYNRIILLKSGLLASSILLFLLICSCSTDKNLPDPLKAGWEGEPVCELLEEHAYIRALKCTFPTGVGHERHYHDSHFGYTVKGSRFRITDTEGTREIDVSTGGHFYSEGIQWHEVLNIGDSTAVFLIIEPKENENAELNFRFNRT